MPLQTSFKIPKTMIRLSQSIDFVGYIYPQIFTTGQLNILPSDPTKPGSAGRGSQGITNNIFQALIGQVLGQQQGVLLGGIKKFDKTFSRENFKRQKLGYYEYFQVIPGKIGVTLNLDRVVLYQNNNALDKMLDINYDGLAHQAAPLLIIENLEDPDGNIKSIMYMDCWSKNSKITYDLENKIQVINGLTLDCPKVFLPIDTMPDITNEIVSGAGLAGLATNMLVTTFNINSTL